MRNIETQMILKRILMRHLDGWMRLPMDVGDVQEMHRAAEPRRMWPVLLSSHATKQPANN